MRILGIGGEPATGKSTLVRELMKGFGGSMPERFVWEQLKGHWFKEAKTYVLGTYNFGEEFQGTDRLAMSVQPHAEAFLRHLTNTDPMARVVFEGDRLFNGKFISLCLSLVAPSDAMFLVLVAEEAEKQERHQERGDTQGATFLKGRATKHRNLLIQFPQALTTAPHQVPNDTVRLLARCHAWLRGGVEAANVG